MANNKKVGYGLVLGIYGVPALLIAGGILGIFDEVWSCLWAMDWSFPLITSAQGTALFWTAFGVDFGLIFLSAVIKAAIIH